MDKKTDNTLARFESNRPGIPLMVVGGILVLLLMSGAVYAIQLAVWTLAAVFASAFLLLCAFLLLSYGRERSRAAAGDRRAIKWDAALPEVQRQSVNLEVRELVRLLDVGPEQLTDLLSAYIVAEDLALRQIQQEEKQPLLRHVELGGIPFDAILVEQDLITCIEVAFLVVPDVRQDKIESMLKKITLYKQNLAELKSRLRLRLMLVLVTQLTQDEEERLKGMLSTRRFSDTPVDIDIRMLDFEVLQRVYVSE
jgi:hypothetical protein